MKKYTVGQKERGEVAMNYLSGDALDYYTSTDPISVYEVENEDGEKRYDVIESGYEKLGLTFDEVVEMFTEQYKESTTITLTEIADALIENDSMEQEGNTARYFLHITDQGEILPTLVGADVTFTADADVEGKEGDWREDFEKYNNEEFMDICEDLWRQANKYLKTWKEEN